MVGVDGDGNWRRDTRSFYSDAQFVSKKEQKITMRGRVTFPGGSKIPIEPDAKLTVELQDTSLADAPAKIIARGTGKAVRFPMAFAIRYSPSEVADGIVYSITVTIRNKNDELLYVNDVRVLVTPLGAERTKFIDVPVILTKSEWHATKFEPCEGICAFRSDKAWRWESAMA